MAYTYDDFTTAASKAGLSFDQADLDIAKVNPEYGISLVKLTQDVNSAGTAEQKLLAQEAVNQLRKSYSSTAAGTTAGSFAYGKQDTYDQMLDKVVNRTPFSYDITTDPLYSSYKKTYLREADRARQDTMAQASAMSGGRPSSYAVNAAQQAGNYFVGQLNDKVPELRANAFQEYLSNYSNDLSALNAMGTDRELDFNEYLQQYTEQQQAWNNALTLLQAGYDTPEIRKILGLPEEDTSVGAAEASSKKSSDGTGGQTYTYDSILADSIQMLEENKKAPTTSAVGGQSNYAAIKQFQDAAVKAGYITADQQKQMMREVTEKRNSRS